MGKDRASESPGLGKCLEPMTIGNLDIWSDVVEKVHNPEILRRNQERISILTGQDAAQKRFHSSLHTTGRIQRPLEELAVIMLFRRVVYFGFSGSKVSDSLGCEISDSRM